MVGGQKAKVERWTHICGGCGSCMEASLKAPGSFLVEILAWILFFPVGIVYSLWRHRNRRATCPVCGSVDVVEGDLPRGRALLEQYHGAKLPE